MKILHCCLSCFYIDGYNYQENVLPRIHHKNGNNVKILASTETFNENKKLTYIEPVTYLSEDGVEVTRIPYKQILPHKLMKKLRAYYGAYEFLESFKPDVILFHGIPAYELLTVTRYKRNNPQVMLYVDSHEDSNNSGRNFISKQILHKTIYRLIIKRALKHIDKILYITDEVKDFLTDNYRIPERMLEYYPLGGEILDKEAKIRYRDSVLKQHNIDDASIIMTHSGKLNENKKTIDLLKAFIKTRNNSFKLFIIGSVSEDISNEFFDLIALDDRIEFLGWRNPEELIRYIAASDIYLQPGSQSATMQNSLCAGTPVMFTNVKSHKRFMNGCSYVIDSVDDIGKIFDQISYDPFSLKKMSEFAYQIAGEILDYEKLADRVCERKL